MGNITPQIVNDNTTFTKTNGIITLYFIYSPDSHTKFWYKSTYKNYFDNMADTTMASVSVDGIYEFLEPIEPIEAITVNAIVLAIIYTYCPKKAFKYGYYKSALTANISINKVSSNLKIVSLSSNLKPNDLIVDNLENVIFSLNLKKNK